jgi:membrane fusion protein, protease secretion system
MSFLKGLQFWKRREKDDAVDAILAAEQPEPPVDTGISSRRGLLALFVGLGVVVLWAALAPLSQGVPVVGFLKVEGNRKTVQHLRGGIVEQILVSEGEAVKQNQPLVSFNATQVKAQFGIVESQLIGALAMEARLVAERSRKSGIEFPEFLRVRELNPAAREAMTLQETLFRSRQVTLRGEEAIVLQTIAGLEQQIAGIEAQEKAKTEQLRLFAEELDSLKPMYEKGFVPRNRMFELERTIAYLSGGRSEDQANLGRARSQISEMRLRIFQSKDVFHKEVETQLAEVQRQVADLRERMIAIEDDLTRIVVRSPTDGVVVDMSVFTVGGIVSPGQKLMDVVPGDRMLQIEVHIPTQLADNVTPGLAADINFAAFDNFDVPRIPGTLVYFSADRLTDPRTAEAYYLGRVEVKPEAMVLLGKHKLVAGMPANVVIITGERSVLGYLVHPLVSRLQFAFTER